MKPTNKEHEGQPPPGAVNSGIAGGLSKRLSEHREHRQKVRQFRDNVESVEHRGYRPTLWRKILFWFLNLTMGPRAAEELANSDERISVVAIYRHWRQSRNEHLETNRQNRRDFLETRREQREALREQRTQVYKPTLKVRLFILLDYDPTHNESGESSEATVIGAVFHFLARVIGTRILEILGVIFVCAIGYLCYLAIAQN